MQVARWLELPSAHLIPSLHLSIPPCTLHPTTLCILYLYSTACAHIAPSPLSQHLFPTPHRPDGPNTPHQHLTPLPCPLHTLRPAPSTRYAPCTYTHSPTTTLHPLHPLPPISLLSSLSVPSSPSASHFQGLQFFWVYPFFRVYPFLGFIHCSGYLQPTALARTKEARSPTLRPPPHRALTHIGRHGHQCTHGAAAPSHRPFPPPHPQPLFTAPIPFFPTPRHPGPPPPPPPPPLAPSRTGAA